jgi:hypothetical protein
MKIKMGGSVRDWVNTSIRLLDAISLSTKYTVKVAGWFKRLPKRYTAA